MDIDRAIDAMTLGNTKEPTQVPRPRDRPAFTRILVGYDGSPASSHALAWASHLARLHHAQVVVASIVPPSYLASAGWAMAYAVPVVEEHRAVVARMRELCQEGAAKLRAEGIEAESVSSEGDPPREIAAIARTHRADLIILGARASGALSRVILGSVAESVLGRVETSVLVARRAPRTRNVLVATDGSAPSFRAVAAALRYASMIHGDVTVQHVIEASEDATSLPPEGFLKEVITKMKLDTPPHVKYVLDVGRPATRIVERGRAEDSELIVVGARGLGRVTGALMGSVSHRVANAADTNVLVVREK